MSAQLKLEEMNTRLPEARKDETQGREVLFFFTHTHTWLRIKKYYLYSFLLILFLCYLQYVEYLDQDFIRLSRVFIQVLWLLYKKKMIKVFVLKSRNLLYYQLIFL